MTYKAWKEIWIEPAKSRAIHSQHFENSAIAPCKITKLVWALFLEMFFQIDLDSSV